MTSPTVLMPPRHYLNDGYGITSWLLTRDHKRIALLYLAAVTFFFFVGGAFAVLIRLELATPAGDLVTDETYNKLFTMHGVMMVFFFLIPVDSRRARQLPRADHDRREGPGVPEAEPGELVHLHDRRRSSRSTPWSPAASTPAGPSTRRSAPSSSNTNVIPTALGIFITGFSSILTGLNFIVTIHRMRAPGHDLVPAAAVHLVASTRPA